MHVQIIKFLTILLMFILLCACGNGGGSGNTNGGLILSLPTSVAAGKPVAATAVLSSNSNRPLNNLTVRYISDNKSVIPDFTDTNGTNFNGISQVSIATRNVLATTATVNIYAVVDGVSSNSISVTVTPAKLTLTPPAAATISVASDPITKLCSGGIARLVNSGAQIQFSDPSGQNVGQQPVAITVSSITNGIAGLDQVVLYPGAAEEVTIPPYTSSVTKATDTNGVWFLPVAIDGIIPAASGGQHVFTVNWQASTQKMGDAGVNISYIVTGQTLLTTACN